MLPGPPCRFVSLAHTHTHTHTMPVGLSCVPHSSLLRGQRASPRPPMHAIPHSIPPSPPPGSLIAYSCGSRGSSGFSMSAGSLFSKAWHAAVPLFRFTPLSSRHPEPPPLFSGAPSDARTRNPLPSTHTHPTPHLLFSLYSLPLSLSLSFSLSLPLSLCLCQLHPTMLTTKPFHIGSFPHHAAAPPAPWDPHGIHVDTRGYTVRKNTCKHYCIRRRTPKNPAPGPRGPHTFRPNFLEGLCLFVTNPCGVVCGGGAAVVASPFASPCS